jgi:hypothetical protein
MRVPRTLVSMPSIGLSSTIGTCLRAAAWKTRWGRSVGGDGADPGLVADVGDEGLARDAGGVFGEFEVDLPEGEFAVVEQDERVRGRGRRPGGRARSRWCRRRR